MKTTGDETARVSPASPFLVLWVFLRLGLTSFGGPVAHLGYFRTEFVERRKWLTDREYGELVALSQFLPGPASSQVGFAIGLLRSGFSGAIAAFIGFTLPSVILMLAFAAGASLFGGDVGQGVLAGLNIVAVAIVAHAVWGMTKTLTPDPTRASIAVAAIVVTLGLGGSLGQICAIALGVAAGLLLTRKPLDDVGTSQLRFTVRRRTGIVSLALFATILALGPVFAALTGDSVWRLFDVFFRSGALVFGGGHVVLPLLEAGVVDTGWTTTSQFLAGYGAAQALPGPLFSFAAYLGAIVNVGPGGALGALIATVGIFLPGFLLLVGVIPFWNRVRHTVWMQAATRGAGAAVVGILASALYSPIFVSAVTGPFAFALAALCFVLLVSWELPPWLVVILGALGGAVLVLLTGLTGG